MDTNLDLSGLLADDAWARQLACALTRRGDEAEDLVQEVHVRALERRGGPLRAPRAWFARVLRNLELDRRRAAARRPSHEALPAQDDPYEPRSVEATPDVLAARVEVQERLAAAVLALEPRQRDVVLLRHFDGAPVADIARRLGLARATVHEHLERAHAALRARLGPLDDDSRELRGLMWLASLPLAPSAATTVVAGAAAGPALPAALLMLKLTKPLIAAVVLAALTFTLWNRGPIARPAQEVASSGAPVDLAPVEALAAASVDEAVLTERAPVPTAPAGVVAPAEPIAFAVLRVQVVDEQQRGVAGVMVYVETKQNEDGQASWHTSRMLNTDSNGLVVVDVPAALELEVSALSSDHSSGGVAPVSAIPAHGVGTATVAVQVLADLALAVQVVDALTHEPVASARVAGYVTPPFGRGASQRVGVLSADTSDGALTDARGYAQVPAWSWRGGWCAVRAAGYAPSTLALPQSATAEPMWVELKRAARVEGRALGGPSMGVVRARFASDAGGSGALMRAVPPELEVSCAVDPEGSFVLGELPGGASVALALYDALTGALVHRPATPLSTLTGETHTVEWDLRATRRIVCTVRESNGAAAVGFDVLLFDSPKTRAGATLPRSGALAVGTTDGSGVAVLDGIGAGKWVVGLAPSAAFAAYSVEVDVADAPGETSVAFTLHRDLFIEGRVDAANGATPDAYVSATNAQFHVYMDVRATDEGRFRIGPLLPGDYALSASTSPLLREGLSYAPSLPVTVSAGTNGVVLTLRQGGRVVLSALDPLSRAPVEAQFIVSGIGASGGYWSNGSPRTSAAFDGLELGEYLALASAPDGRVGVAMPVRVVAESVTTVEVVLGEGGTLAVTAPAGVDASIGRGVYVLYGDALVEILNLAPAEQARLVLSPGRYRIGVVERGRTDAALTWRERLQGVQDVDVRPGEVTAVELRL
ncbi:MAG: sigma-70 family RNA polymerase sigma factor [Planctomycetota bacterium]